MVPLVMLWLLTLKMKLLPAGMLQPTDCITPFAGIEPLQSVLPPPITYQVRMPEPLSLIDMTARWLAAELRDALQKSEVPLQVTVVALMAAFAGVAMATPIPARVITLKAAAILFAFTVDFISYLPLFAERRRLVPRPASNRAGGSNDNDQ